MHEGLSRGARCLFVGRPADYEDALRADLEELGICTKRATARGALHSRRQPKRSTSNGGSFDPAPSLARYDAHDRRGAGRRLHRPAHDRRADGRPGRHRLAQDRLVRSAGQRALRAPPVLRACAGTLGALVPPERVRDVLRTHPIAIVRGEQCDNPFYERPELVLERRQPHPARLAVPPAARATPRPPASRGHDASPRSPPRPSWPASCTTSVPAWPSPKPD